MSILDILQNAVYYHFVSDSSCLTVGISYFYLLKHIPFCCLEKVSNNNVQEVRKAISLFHSSR